MKIYGLALFGIGIVAFGAGCSGEGAQTVEELAGEHDTLGGRAPAWNCLSGECPVYECDTAKQDVIEGNPTCESAGLGETLAKIDPVRSGSYYLRGGGKVTLDVNGRYFDWYATEPIGSVLVKGGPNARKYIYGGAQWDKDLHAPINEESECRPYGLSNVSFCSGGYLALKVKNIAEPSYEVLDVPGRWYTPFVVGTIDIINRTQFQATVESVTDKMQGMPDLPVDCGAVTFPFQLGPGESFKCYYDTQLPDSTQRINEAIVETSGQVKGAIGKTIISFEGLECPRFNVYGGCP